MSERPSEDRSDKEQGNKKSPDLDNEKDPENRKLTDQFRKDFGNKMSGDTLLVTRKQGGVEYKYFFRLNSSGTITIIKVNESEKKEKKQAGLDAPEPKKVTVTMKRLYADKVIGFPEIGKVLEENKGQPAAAKDEAPTPPNAEAGDDVPSPKRRGKFQLEGGVMVPQKTDTATEERYALGGEMVGRYVLTDPRKSYVAIIVPMQYESGTRTLKPVNGQLVVSDTGTLSFSTGVGVEAGYKPVRALTFYGAAGLKGQYSIVEYTNVSQTDNGLLVDDGVRKEFKPGVFVAAGARVNVTDRWHIFAVIQPTKTSGAEVQAPIFVGGGYSFK